MRLIAFLVSLMIVASATAAEPAWQFIWVTAGDGVWHTRQGSGIVTVTKNGQLNATLTEAQGTKYVIAGQVTKGQVSAKIANTDSDYFQGSPIRGTYKKQTFKYFSPCGLEIFNLYDGYNFLGIQRRFDEPECKP